MNLISVKTRIMIDYIQLKYQKKHKHSEKL